MQFAEAISGSLGQPLSQLATIPVVVPGHRGIRPAQGRQRRLMLASQRLV